MVLFDDSIDIIYNKIMLYYEMIWNKLNCYSYYSACGGKAHIGRQACETGYLKVTNIKGEEKRK